MPRVRGRGREFELRSRSEMEVVEHNCTMYGRDGIEH